MTEQLSLLRQYNIIYADPPWHYNDQCHAGERGAGYKYPLMSDAEIGNLPIRNLAARDSALFLWATFPRLDIALQVMSAWGFTYKTAAFVWLKTNKKADTFFWGMGNWTRANTEVCLLGIRGKPQRQSASVHQIIQAPISGHSAKPAIARDKIVELMGDLPRVELFARQSSPGWDVFGNEVQDSISLDIQINHHSSA